MPDPAVDAAAVPDLLARERRDHAPALGSAASGRTMSYRDLCTTAYKAGNALAHVGVREGDRVAVEPRSAPEPILTFLGAALAGARAEFRADPGTDARAVLAHVDREDAFDLPPGSRLIAFGGSPERATTTHWEATVWSENPAFPPAEYDPDAPVLEADGDTHSHRDLLEAAHRAVDTLGLDGDAEVLVRAPLSDPATVAAGVVAPLLVGGSVRLPADGAAGGGTVAVVDGHDAGEDGFDAGEDGEVVALDVADVRL